jgi:hypothetical protein
LGWANGVEGFDDYYEWAKLPSCDDLLGAYWEMEDELGYQSI